MTPNENYNITNRSFFGILLISLCIALYFSPNLFSFIIWFVTIFVISVALVKRSFISVFLISFFLALYLSTTLYTFIFLFVIFFGFLFGIAKVFQTYLTTAHKNPYGRIGSSSSFSAFGTNVSNIGIPSYGTSSSHYNQMYTPPLETDTRDIDVDSVHNANKVCFYCGNHIDPGDNFCQSCGKERT